MTSHGINIVKAPTSNQAGGYANWYWYETVWDAGANAWRADINIANFNGASSNYLTHIYVYDNAGNQGTKYDLGAIYIKAPGLSVDQFKIGDYVAYQPNTPANATYSTTQDGTERSGGGNQTITKANIANWRVISVSGNKISLVSETIPTVRLTLTGANGYNNGVKLLNDACNTLYKNTTLGATGRSMNVDDVNNLMGVTPSTALNPYYGNEYTPKSKYYPQMFQYEAWGSIDGNYTGSLEFSQQNQWYSGSAQASILKGKWSYYNYGLATYKAINTVEYAMCTGGPGTSGLFNDQTYWLASHCVSQDRFVSGDTFLKYMLFIVKRRAVEGIHLFRSETGNGSGIHSLRPVVDIDLSRVHIGITGTGTSDSPYSIQSR